MANSLTTPRNDMTRCRITITGKVQGVGFRQFVCTKAKILHLGGRVWNNPDGSVEAIFEGNEQPIQSMINFCKQGPRLSYVKEVQIKMEQSVEKVQFDSFEVDHP